MIMFKAESIKNKRILKKLGVFFILNILIITILIPAVYSENIPKLNKTNSEEKVIKIQSKGNENWWEDSWPYRKLITIDHSLIDSNQVNFPFLIHISSDEELKDNAQDDGDDITFILHSDNITKLNHEIEYFNGDSGELFAWINIPILGSSIDTKVWMYYGNSESDNQENIEDTWDSNYILVQHLNEETGTLFDSTSNNNDGTNDNATFNSSAKIDGAYDFDGISNNIDLGTFDIEGDGLTISIWFNADSFSENTICTSGLRLISKATGPESNNHFWMIAPADNGDMYRYRLKTDNTEVSNLIVSTGGLNPSTWYNVVATYDESYMRVYQNGVELGNKVQTGALSTNSSVPVWIASNPPNDYRAFDGVIDEVQISNIARDESWIILTYENQNNPESFITVSEQDICEYSLTISIDGNGEVTKNPDQETYEYGTIVELTATADTGWSFSHWNGDLTGSENPEEITIDSDKEVTAQFTINEYALTINIEGNGSVIKDPNQEEYEYGTTVELTAVPGTGWSFSHWDGDITGSENPANITIDEEKEVTANFSINYYSLTIDVDGQGDVDKDPDEDSYPYGTIVELTAIPDDNWEFSHWSGDLTGGENPGYITIDEDKEVTAHFSQNEFTLTVNVIGNGTVTKDPNQATYPYGTIVELTAQPDTGWLFDSWSGDMTGSENPKEIFIDGDKVVNANFKEDDVPPNVKIISPDYGIYIFNRKLGGFIFPFVFNQITIEVEASDKDSGMEKVEIYIDGELVSSDDEAPYDYLFEKSSKKFHTIDVIGYDNAGNTETDSISVFMFGVKFPLFWLAFAILLVMISGDF
jgi:hypothetical protein